MAIALILPIYLDIFLDIVSAAKYNEVSIEKETLISDFKLEDKSIS